MTDVKNPRCECGTQARYGFPHNRPQYCIKHKIEGTIVNPRKTCIEGKCKEFASYGKLTPSHCEIHHTKDEINLVERICTQCGKLDVVVDGICVNFCQNGEKVKEYRKQFKLKENRVLKLLRENFGEPTEYNKRIPTDCGDKTEKGYRLEEKEICYEINNTHKIFIEVDEHQHKSYCELGEINRMKNLFFGEGSDQPIVFIRYNPDSFLEQNGKKGKITQKEREQQLLAWFKKVANEPPSSLLTVIYLFYDKIKSEPYSIDLYSETTDDCEKCSKRFYIRDMFERHNC
jgi:hypothetical protein